MEERRLPTSARWHQEGYQHIHAHLKYHNRFAEHLNLSVVSVATPPGEKLGVIHFVWLTSNFITQQGKSL